MSKYIIKNCPAYCYLGKECHSREGQYGASCCEVVDCDMKQIVEKCKDKIRIYECYDTDYAQGKVNCAESILQLFDIQEIE